MNIEDHLRTINNFPKPGIAFKDISPQAPFHGVNARAALQLAHARGVLLAVLAGAGVPVAEYAPATVKKAVAMNGRAEKAQVQAMVSLLLGLDEPLKQPDLADALAVALCHSSGLGGAPARGSAAAARRGVTTRCCAACMAEGHDADASFCKACGAELEASGEQA